MAWSEQTIWPGCRACSVQTLPLWQPVQIMHPNTLLDLLQPLASGGCAWRRPPAAAPAAWRCGVSSAWHAASR